VVGKVKLDKAAELVNNRIPDGGLSGKTSGLRFKLNFFIHKWRMKNGKS